MRKFLSEKHFLALTIDVLREYHVCDNYEILKKMFKFTSFAEDAADANFTSLHNAISDTTTNDFILIF